MQMSPLPTLILKTVNYSAKLNLPYKDNWRTSIGVSGMNQSNKNKAEEALIPDYNLFDIGGFVFTQYHREKLSLSGGLRFDNRHVDGKANDGRRGNKICSIHQEFFEYIRQCRYQL